MSVPPAPDWLIGLWRRESMTLADGSEDRATRIFWGQTKTLFVDIRVPADRPAPRDCRGFDDFGPEELLRLADQQAFAGHVVFDREGRCNWVRQIDYQPDSGRPDRGYLELEGESLHERGEADSVIGLPYHEVYHREAGGTGRRLALRREADGAFLIVLDDRFLFAKPRTLPKARNLRALIAAAGDDRARVEAYLDCEVSFGQVETGWQIDLSTLPWREGRRLLPPGAANLEADRLTLASDEGRASWRILDNSLSAAALGTLFGA